MPRGSRPIAAVRSLPIMRANALPLSGVLRLAALAAHFPMSFRPESQHRRLRICVAYARARAAFKAARFRPRIKSGVVQLRAAARCPRLREDSL